MRKKGVFVLLIVVMGIVGYNYLYQGHRDISSEKPSFVGSAKEFINKFSSNPEIAEKEYLDRSIQVFGTITELNRSDLTLNNMVFCLFTKALKDDLSLGDDVTIKGRVIGYDTLLEQVKLSECVILIEN